jgi:hypothetical protein
MVGKGYERRNPADKEISEGRFIQSNKLQRFSKRLIRKLELSL